LKAEKESNALEFGLKTDLLEAGVDEAGRGCLAGPVTGAAVILPPGFDVSGIRDSKLLSPAKRNYFRQLIEEKAFAWAVGWATQEEIDEINILQASLLAMKRAIDQLSPQPEHVLVDGRQLIPDLSIPQTAKIKADLYFTSVAAASILAKTHRDEYMVRIHDTFPEYNWKQNKGYPTQEHRSAVLNMGITIHHRRTFIGCQ